MLLRYEISELEGVGRLCVGEFPEFAAGLSKPQAAFLAAWWGILVEHNKKATLLWGYRRRFRFALRLKKSRGIESSWEHRWEEVSLAHVRAHGFRRINAQCLVPNLVLQLWAESGFGLFGLGASDDVDVASLSLLARAQPPEVEVLRRATFVVVPWHHRLWMDLYCQLGEIEANVGHIRAAAQLVGVEVERVYDTYA